MTHLSPDGKFLAFVAERIAGEGERLLPTDLNVRQEDFEPCVITLR